MKTIINKILTLSIALFALVVTSCIDVKQDIWINEDGSGKLVFDVGLSKQFKAMMDLQKGFGDLEGLGGLEEEDGDDKDGPGPEDLESIPFAQDPEEVIKELKKSEHVTNAEFKEASEGKYERTIYTIELSDITKIKEVMKSSSLGSGIEELGGEEGLSENNDFDLTKTESGTFELSAVMEGEKEENADPTEAAFAAAMMKEMFGDAGMTIRVHAPAVKHNGKEQDGAIVWTMLLAELASGKSLEAKGEFKGGESSKKEEPKEEEPKEEEPEETNDETVSNEEAPAAATEESGSNLLVISIFVLAAVLLLGIIVISRKKN
jgi:hypothetical protein